ncbi:unnamed protein product [Camellia sinensis]
MTDIDDPPTDELPIMLEEIYKCPTCDACRYKLNDDGGKKIPHKRVDDDILRHPADGEAWKDFDKQHPTFSDD